VITHKTNLTPQIGYNEGIDWASSEFFLLLDADDVIAPGSLPRALSVLSADRNIAFAHGRGIDAEHPAEAIAAQQEKTPGADWRVSTGSEFIRKVCRTGLCIVSATTVVRRTDMQKAIGYYPLELRRAIDLNMWLRLATLGHVAETNALQGVQRCHAGQLSAFYRDNLICDFIELLNNFEHFFSNEGSRIEHSRAMRRAAARKIASNAFVASAKRLAKGRVKESHELFDFALDTWRKFRFPPAGAVSIPYPLRVLTTEQKESV
jgi:glycosyltransferase involved in cell wall biosynthesis